MADKQINILGQEYTVKFENTRTNKVLKDCDGECRYYPKEIIIDDEIELEEHKCHVIKHEIIHAFLRESGLGKYSTDELIVDWFAWNIGKIQKVIGEVLNDR